MSTPDPASRWAMPARKWRRPTGRDVAFALLWMLVVAGAVLLLTGETTGLVAVTIPIVFTFVSDHYVSGQADGEDDSEDDGEGSPEAPVRVRRALLIFGVGDRALVGSGAHARRHLRHPVVRRGPRDAWLRAPEAVTG